jgi:hypothetical protein
MFTTSYFFSAENWKEKAKKLSVDDVCNFLNKHKALQKYIENFKEEEVDGELLSQVVSERNSDYLKCILVESEAHRQKIFVKFPAFCLDH